MTKEEFIKLPEDDKDIFINSGGMVSVSDVIPVTQQTEQPDKDESPNGVSGFSPSQAVSSSSSLNGELTSPSSTIPDESLDGLLIEDPYDLLCIFDDEVKEGLKYPDDETKVHLHNWQIRFMVDFAANSHVQDFPFQAVMRACNGSGKDKYVIAACAVWVCMRYKNTTCPVTSSSGFQLDNQTCKHTRRLCEAVNRKLGFEAWDIKYRNYTFRFEVGDNKYNSQILCYATDEAGKAEGFHPVEMGKKMAIFCSEDKTIPDEINDAINKCTGYTHRVHASTPGKSFGHFYDYCQMAVSRKAIKNVKEAGPTDWIEYHVKSDDCPHLGKNYKEKAAKNIPGGENSPAYKSQVDAEFGGDDGEMVVIPYTYVWQAVRNTFNRAWHKEEFNEGGLDLADGGAETALAIRNGNKLLKVIPFKFDNTPDTIRFLIEKFKENELDNPKALIRGDSVGAGKPVLDILRGMGWKNIRYVDSRLKAYNPKVYKNRNAELWFHLRGLLEKHALILLQDKILEKQLGSRHYKIMGGAIHQMLTKLEEKSKGFPSPDRADAVNLAFWNYRPEFIELEDEQNEEDKPFNIPEREEENYTPFSIKEWASGRDKKPKINEHTDFDAEDKEDLLGEIAKLNATIKQ